MAWHLFFLIVLFSNEQLAQSTEVDSFTNRNVRHQDSADVLDAEVNRRIANGIRRANRAGACSKSLLSFSVGAELRAGITGGFMISPLEVYSNESPSVFRTVEEKSLSVYRDVKVWNSVPISVYPLGRLIKANGHFIGGDKFSHFFNEGFIYYRKYYSRGMTLDEVLSYGRGTEAGRWGLATSGVFSYADLVANFQGMRFWASFFDAPDPLTGQNTPFVQCEEDEWVQIRPFHWSEWVDGGWDEGVNCSRYTDNLSRVIQPVYNLRCPVKEQSCDKLREKYGAVADAILSPTCQ